MPRPMTARQQAMIEMFIAQTKFEIIDAMSNGELSWSTESYAELSETYNLGRYGFCDYMMIRGLLVFPDEPGTPDGTHLDAGYAIVRATIDEWLKGPVMPFNQARPVGEHSNFDDPEWVARAEEDAASATVSPEAFRVALALKLRGVGRFAVARLQELIVAWMEEDEVIFAYLKDDDTRSIEEQFDLDDLLWSEWKDGFARWIYAPIFERFPEVTARISVLNPHNADTGN